MRQFVVNESQLREMLYAFMEYHMNLRDGVNNWEWYGESFNEIVQEFYPEDISIDDIRENDIGFEECIEAMLEGGAFRELLEFEND